MRYSIVALILSSFSGLVIATQPDSYPTVEFTSAPPNQPVTSGAARYAHVASSQPPPDPSNIWNVMATEMKNKQSAKRPSMWSRMHKGLGKQLNGWSYNPDGSVRNNAARVFYETVRQGHQAYRKNLGNNNMAQSSLPADRMHANFCAIGEAVRVGASVYCQTAGSSPNSLGSRIKPHVEATRDATRALRNEYNQVPKDYAPTDTWNQRLTKMSVALAKAAKNKHSGGKNSNQYSSQGTDYPQDSGTGSTFENADFPGLGNQDDSYPPKGNRHGGDFGLSSPQGLVRSASVPSNFASTQNWPSARIDSFKSARSEANED